MISFKDNKFSSVAIVICLLFGISLPNNVHGSECKDMAGAEFCEPLKGECYNQEFVQFYMEQCAQTCGLCSQRNLREPETACKPLNNVLGAEQKCGDGYNDGSQCTITCQGGSTITAISPGDAILPMTSGEASVDRLCFCFNGKCDWLGGADFMFCDSSSVPSEWNDWTPSGECSTSCGGGEITHTRTCNGDNCPGVNEKTESCNTQACPQWSAWRSSGSCSKTCGGGTVNFFRTCPVADGCPGNARRSEKCNFNPCVDTCDKLEASANAETTCTNDNKHLSSCTTKCTGGYESATGAMKQLCVCTPAGCKWYGRLTDLSCKRQAPATPAPKLEWSPWSSWSSCPVTCGRGERSRTRTCSGDKCEGSSVEMKTCLSSEVCPCSCENKKCEDRNKRVCAKNATPIRCRYQNYLKINCEKSCGVCKECECGTWSEWTAGTCSADCGKGRRILTRTCPDGKTCDGDSTKREDCEGACTKEPDSADKKAESTKKDESKSTKKPKKWTWWG